MALVFDDRIIQAVRDMEFTYELYEHQLNIGDVTYYAIEEGLDKNTTINIMSYMYGVYEDIAVNGNDQETRRHAMAMMNLFDAAINVLDHDNFDSQMDEIAFNGEEALNVPPGMGPQYGLYPECI